MHPILFGFQSLDSCELVSGNRRPEPQTFSRLPLLSVLILDPVVFGLYLKSDFPRRLSLALDGRGLVNVDISVFDVTGVRDGNAASGLGKPAPGRRPPGIWHLSPVTRLNNDLCNRISPGIKVWLDQKHLDTACRSPRRPFCA
jgi:hypothetical protein